MKAEVTIGLEETEVLNPGDFVVSDTGEEYALIVEKYSGGLMAVMLNDYDAQFKAFDILAGSGFWKKTSAKIKIESTN